MSQRYGSSTIFTSALYPVAVLEQLSGVSVVPIHRPFYNNGLAEKILASVSFLSGTIAATLVTYSNYPAEKVLGGVTWLSGTVTLGLLTYTNWPAEGVQGVGVSLQSGTITLALLTYSNYPAEKILGGVTWISGTIT